MGTVASLMDLTLALHTGISRRFVVLHVTDE
jgi:hypothetical protein